MAIPAEPAASRSPADVGFGRLFSRIHDAVVVGDAQTGRIVLGNPAAARMFGYAEAELVGMPIEMLVPDSHKQQHRLGLAHYSLTGTGQLIDGGVPVELSARRKDGTEFWIELSLSPLETADAAGRLVLAIVRDVTRRKMVETERLERIRAETAQAESQKRARVAAMSEAIGGALADSGKLNESLGKAAEAVVAYFRAAFVRIWTLNEVHRVLELRASAGLYTHLDGAHSRVALGQLKIGRIAADRKPYLTNDVVADPQVDHDWAKHERMVAFAGYPLIVEQRVVGVLGLFARHELEDETLEQLAMVAEMVAQYIQRKLAEENLETSERRFRAMIEHAQGIISILDADGTITYESPYVQGVLGYTHGERVGTNGLDLIHPEQREQALQSFADLVGSPGATVSAEFRFKHADESWRWLEVTGHNLLQDPAVSGIVVHMRDISERKRSEQELQLSEERFRALIERSSDMITLHRRDGTITYATPATARVLGYEPSMLLERNLLEYVYPEDRDAVSRAFRELLTEPGRSTTGRYRMRHRDGSLRWIETTRTNLLHEPWVAAVVCNRRDVTTEVEAQQLLEQTVSDRTQELLRLLEVSRAMGSTLEWKHLIELIFDQLKVIFDYSAVGLHIATEEDEYQTVDYRGPLPRERMIANRNSPAIVALLKRAGSTGRPVIIGDFGGETPMMDRFADQGIQLPPEAFGHARATLVTPLLARGRHIGGLILMHRIPGFYTAQHAEYVMAFAQHAAVAIENARLYEALRDKTALEERQRLARELHDSVSQALYAIALNGAAAGESLRKQDRLRAARQVKHVRQLARAGLAEMRALIFELRAESLAEEGLVAALTKQAAAVEARHELKIRSTFASEPAVRLQTKEALYRIAQEALHNVVKHAHAKRVDLELAVDDHDVTLTIRDNGAGFEVGAFPGHLGLRSMHERAQALGGMLEVSSERGAGTTVRAQLPL